MLRAIAESAALMQRLVTDLVDLARFQSGAIRLDITRFEARSLAEDAINAMDALFQSHEHAVVLDAPSRVWVHADRRRCQQALVNLLSNANKFAPVGSAITLRVGALDEEITWTVVDEGPGIPASVRPYLFERFFTLSRGDSRNADGTGLGLPIAMAIAQAHAGTIDVDSAPGQGSAFTLRIPARAEETSETQ